MERDNEKNRPLGGPGCNVQKDERMLTCKYKSFVIIPLKTEQML